MRIRTRRRRLLIILKLIFIFILFYILYYAGRSFFGGKKSERPKSIRPRVLVVESEGDELDLWRSLTDEQHHRSRTLFTINSHCDDGLYMLWNKTFLQINNFDDILNRLEIIPMHNLYHAVAGFVNQIFCIYPWWKNNNDVFSNKTHYLGVWKEYLCICSLNNNETFFNDSICQIIQGDINISLNPDNCQPLSNRWRSLTMQDVYAQTLQKDSTFTEPTILSINLDFFTVDEGSFLLTKDIIIVIERKLSLIICPTRIEDESIIDVWFQRILSMSKSKSFKEVETVNLPLCINKRVKINAQVRSLLVTLHDLSKDQRDQLSEAGLCILSRTSLTPVICSNQLARLTDLHNRTHSANKSEISLQMEKLKTILKQSVREPWIISIVRSTRLGLVSPINQRILESLLIEELSNLYNINRTEIVFHPNLLGGAQGWSHREGLL